MDPEKKADTKMLRAKDGMNENDLDIEFDKGSKYSRKCKMVTAILIASFIVAIIIIVVLVLVLRTKKDDKITTVVPATESIPPLPTGGTSASGVPGDVNGYYTVWKKYGRLSWRELVQPAIDMAKKGFRFGKSAHEAGLRSLKYIKKDPGLRELLIDDKGNLKELGAVLKMPKFARTLEIIRDDPDSFYNGSLAQDIVKDIQEGGGIITLEDLKNYQTAERTPLSQTMGDYTLYTNPPPGSGAVLSLILNILKGYNFTEDSRKDLNSSVLTFHRIVEAFKFGYAYRALLGDEDFWNVTEIVKDMTSEAFAESLRRKIYDNRTFENYTYYGDFYARPSDQGTTHLSIISPDGDAVAVTTSINL